MNLQAFVFLVLAWSIIAKNRYCSDVYPSSVSKYKVRLDYYSNETVSSGRVHTLKKVTSLSSFRKHLQCARKDANLNFNSGVLSTLQLLPSSLDMLKSVCACIENKQFMEDGGLHKCALAIADYEVGKYSSVAGFNLVNYYAPVQLLRVIRGALYYDWPRGVDRFKESINTNTLVPLLKLTLSKISDMNDSVFFVGGDDPAFPVDSSPLSMFSHSTSDSYAEMIFPWYEMWENATLSYLNFRKHQLEYSEENFRVLEPGYLEWEKRIPKAAYFASMTRHRQFMFDLARRRPDLIDAHFPFKDCVDPWHPASTEVCFNHNKTFPSYDTIKNSQHLPPGYAEALYTLSGTRPVDYQAGSYKYVVVPLGGAPGVGLSTSARIHHLLAHSGAVLLMPRSSFKYHFSAQFEPWVHFVPLSFSGADLGEKIQWLLDHDDLAKQIAENGRNFARSYLRLEDYYCYAAGVLEVMARVSALNDTKVTKTWWKPQFIRGLAVRFDRKEVLQWPT